MFFSTVHFFCFRRPVAIRVSVPVKNVIDLLPLSWKDCNSNLVQQSLKVLYCLVSVYFQDGGSNQF